MSDLDDREQRNVLAALRVLHRQQRTTTALARGLGLTELAVRVVLREERPPSANVAIRAAKLAGVAVDDLLSGAYPSRGMCPHCGLSLAAFVDEKTNPGMQ